MQFGRDFLNGIRKSRTESRDRPSKVCSARPVLDASADIDQPEVGVLPFPVRQWRRCGLCGQGVLAACAMTEFVPVAGQSFTSQSFAIFWFAITSGSLSK